MRKNLHDQLLKRLKKLKNKEKNSFLQRVCLNSRFNLFKKQQLDVPLRLQILLYSRQSNLLIKKKVFNTQITTQCSLTWRSRSIYSFFTLSRITLRELAHYGLLKGVKKASW